MLEKLTSVFRPRKSALRCIGAYHKAGTVWLNGIFREVADELQLSFLEVESDTLKTSAFDGKAIAFNHSSRFPEFMFESPVLGVRIIRDPRDMVISGAHYHGRGVEAWLNAKQDVFGGRSYCEAINALETVQEKYRFEMKHTASYVMRQMVNADHNEALHRFIDQNFLTIRYEDLINDQGLVDVKKICEKLDLQIKTVGPVFVKHSLFGEKKKDSKHIRSGKTQQWKTEFDRQTAEEFSALHQEALEALGYETNSDWVRQL
tara:strand:+ start:102 stop:884 length:783 start_codon:yes stop_codon:yes gene_type:complete